jgi:hypothetical protein
MPFSLQPASECGICQFQNSAYIDGLLGGVQRRTHQDIIGKFKKGKRMLRDKYRHALIRTSTILLAPVGALMFPVLRAEAAGPKTQRSLRHFGPSAQCAMVKMDLAPQLERL